MPLSRLELPRLPAIAGGGTMMAAALATLLLVLAAAPAALAQVTCCASAATCCAGLAGPQPNPMDAACRSYLNCAGVRSAVVSCGSALVYNPATKKCAPASSVVCQPCRCKAGTGGPACALCPRGQWSAGGTSSVAKPSCSACRANRTTSNTGSTSATACSGVYVDENRSSLLSFGSNDDCVMLSSLAAHH